MPKPLTVQFGPWIPDQANTPVPVTGVALELPLADCLNVSYTNGNYQSLPTAVWNGVALPSQCLGAFTAIDQQGNPQMYAGTQNGVYHWDGAAWDDVGGGTVFFAAEWSFAQFGASIIAAYSPPQLGAPIATWLNTVGVRYLTMPIGGSAFANSSGAPSGSVVGVISQFALVGDIWSSPGYTLIGTGNASTEVFTATLGNVPIAPFYVYAGVFTTSSEAAVIAVGDDGEGNFSTAGMTGTLDYSTGVITLSFTSPPTNLQSVRVFYLQRNPARLQWSGIADQTNWPVPLTNTAIAFQSGYEDLTADFGQIQYIAGFPLFGVALQRSGLTRLSYVGGDVVFSFAPYERTHGPVSKLAVVVVGQIIYFVSDEGFFATDGSSVSPIGDADASGESIGIDQWFKDNVNQMALDAVSAGYDSNTRCVHFAVPTGVNSLPDTLLIYNPAAQRWTRGAQSCELVFTDRPGDDHQLGLFSTTHSFGTLTGTPQTGYVESNDMMFLDGRIRLTVGVKPMMVASDTPTARMGFRKDTEDAIKYTHDASREPFSRICPLFAQEFYQRVRLSSTSAAAFNGAQLLQEIVGAL